MLPNLTVATPSLNAMATLLHLATEAPDRFQSKRSDILGCPGWLALHSTRGSCLTGPLQGAPVAAPAHMRGSGLLWWRIIETAAYSTGVPSASWVGMLRTSMCSKVDSISVTGVGSSTSITAPEESTYAT